MISFVSRTLEAMTIPFTIRLVTSDKESAQLRLDEVAQSIHKELLRLEEKFSAFKPTSLVCRFQRGEKDVMLDPEFQEVYVAVIAAHKETEAYFDPYYEGVYNPTGYVKGWAIETVFNRFLRPLFAYDYIKAISLNGGGDMQFETAVDSDFVWKVGIENPDKLNEIVAVFKLANGSIATSGKSKRGEHLFTKGKKDLKQVTIVGEKLSWTDLWATAGFSAGQLQLEHFIEKEALTGLFITSEGVHSFHQGELENVKKT